MDFNLNVLIAKGLTEKLITKRISRNTLTKLQIGAKHLENGGKNIGLSFLVKNAEKTILHV